MIRSTPLRLTVILVSIFAASATIAFSVAFLVVRSGFDVALKSEIDQIVVTYRAIGDQDDLLQRLADDASAALPKIRVLQYLPDGGDRIANIDRIPPLSGYAILSEDDITAAGDLADSYMVRSARVGRGQLIVGQTRERVEETGEVFLMVLLVGLLPTLGVAAGAGYIAARRARRKLGAIQAVLSELTAGQLSARVVRSGERDDLSDIGDAVNAMAAAQEALVSSMRQVSGDIAHDLKTPIQRVAILLDQIKRRTILTTGQDDLIDRAINETDRIVKTFQALLQLAQIEGGAVRERLLPTDLREVAEGVVDFLGPDAEDKGFRLELDATGPGPFTVRGERQLLGQVLANLIENAFRHVPAGGAIRVGLSSQAGRVVLEVADDGPGIPPEERGNVLRRLYRLERSRTTDGNGLGLALVAAICDLHGARLSLEDNSPGLMVRVAFPAVSD
jgi:signal transduction histidine kinase